MKEKSSVGIWGVVSFFFFVVVKFVGSKLFGNGFDDLLG